MIKILLLLCLTLLLNADEQKLEKVTIQLQWKHQFEFAGFYAAKEKGFYKDAGLDVELIPLSGKTDIVEDVLSSKADYGVSYSSIIAEYLNGKPIVFVANFFKQSPLVLITQKEITSLSQLKGSKIEGLSGNIKNITLHSMLSKYDIKDNDIYSIPPTFKIDSFANKKVDAMAVFTTNEPFLLDKAGVEYNVFDPVSYGITYYDTNLFTSRDEAIKNPKRVKKLKEASVKGWEYALDNKDEIVDLILRKYNTQNKSREALLFEARQVEQIMLPKIHKIGSISLERVKILAEDFIQSGYVKTGKKYSLENFIFNYKADTFKLTNDEIEYLKKKQRLKICVDPDWMPIEAVVGYDYVGIGSDYLKLFESKLGIDIDVLKTASWSGSVEAMKQGKCDILSLSANTESRKKYINYTDPLLKLPFVIVTSLDKKSVIDFRLLEGETIAVVKGYSLIEKMKKKYPYINLLEVRNIDEGLRKVESGDVFGFADSSVAIDYAYNNGAYHDFKVSAHFDEKMELGYAVNNNDIKLYDIFQKVVKSISYEQKQEILRKWFSLKYKKHSDYSFFWYFAIFLLVVIGIIGYIYYRTRKKNLELQREVKEELEKSKDKDRMIFHQNKLAAMGEMIENIAHQWRQPLSQVNSAVLIIDDVLDEKGIRDEVVEEKLLEIESLTKYMSNTIDDFKDYFNHDKVKDIFVLEEIIQKAIKVLNGKINSNGIELAIDLKNEHLCFGYPNELQQVLLAILNNAIDAVAGNDTKMPKIEVNIERDSIYNYIIICDNGSGISDEDKEKIFEPYYTTKHKAQGTGLGLYISKVIIEDSLGGELSVQNKSDGACFTIKLKVKDEY